VGNTLLDSGESGRTRRSLISVEGQGQLWPAV